ncbi:MAG TPA: D-glycerate dehydrogenase [Paracoccaceae bacterium]|nr:D-glycerate dehydrogenase [Paracoccaceae bacterium]
MTRPRIIVTRKLPEAVEDRLKRHFAVALNKTDEIFTKDKLITAMRHCDGLLATTSDPLDGDVLRADGKRRAQIVSNFAVGVNNIDLDTARAEGLRVTNTPDVLTDATADIALTLILNVTRRTWEHENRLRNGSWTGFALTQGLGTSLQGKTLGIIGMGRIGKAVAKRARDGFGMKIIYFNRSPVADTEGAAEACGSIEDVMRRADIISINAPGGAGNRHMINEDRLRLMKPTAYFINTSRGDVVDEAALIELLKDDRIAGAGLDVYENEPKVPRDLREMENVCLLPHIGSATVETRVAMGMLAVDNLIAHFKGEDLPSAVV